MRALLKRLKPLAVGMRRDRATGHLYYPVDGVRHFVRFPEEAIRPVYRRAAFEQIYFREYRPSGTDVVVDIGAGLGTEIIPLALQAPGLRYIAVEIDPWTYECLCLTLAQLPAGFEPYGLAIGPEPCVRIEPTRGGVDASILGGGRVPVEGISWDAFLARHGVTRVDLLKMNIEGAEGPLLEHIDLAPVERVIVNIHDFRADRGEGEHFRTRARVEARLGVAGFRLKNVDADWIFADRP
jgi:FkbM family methyltransferase